MFGLFKKKSEIDKLSEQYTQLMKDAHQLSTVDRRKSDEKFAAAEEIATRIEALKAKSE